MNRSRDGFDVRTSPLWSTVALGLSGALILIGSDSQPTTLAKTRAALLGVGLYISMFIAWRIIASYPIPGTWLVIAGSSCAAFLAEVWLGMEGALVLLGLATGIAAAFIGLRASILTALLHTLLLTLLPAIVPSIVFPPIGVPIFATWAVVALMGCVYTPVYKILDWSWQNYLMAQAHVAEAREHRAKSEGLLSDLKRANGQLALDNQRMAALRTQADDAQRTKAVFVSRVSHEFRAPLNMIIGLVGLMVERPDVYAEDLPPDLRTDLEVIYRNTTHLSEMINDVLDLSQTEGGAFTLHRESVDLREIVRDAAQVVSPLVQKKGIVLVEELPPDLAPVECDRTRIRQVLLNLLSNAARFTDTGSIVVGITERDCAVEIEVSDTGPGVDQEALDRIFEPFYRATDTAQKVGGSGLGLAISREIILHHGGRIWAESRPGEGASFYFSMPKSAPTPPVARPGHAIVQGWDWYADRFRLNPETRTSQLARPRIVVQDPAGALVHEFQRADSAVEVVAARTPQETLSEAAAYSTQAIVLNTDKRSGFPPSQEIRMLRSQIPHIPVLACSVPNPMARVVAAGADGYLLKPVSHESLVGLVQHLPKVPRSVLVVDDDPESSHMVDRMLRLAYPELEVYVAATGQAALSLVRHSVPDLVLLDIVLPDTDGWTLLSTLRQTLEACDVPVFFVSAQDPTEVSLRSDAILATVDGGIQAGKLLDISLCLADKLKGS